jgi:prolyl-tRNA editing enzyme YbaK/EbsC (Cys-tRNA(Pro) deacylase)
MMADSASQLSSSARRVQQALDTQGVRLQVQELPQSTRTAADAAAAVNCMVGQIAKSLVLVTESSGQPILAIVSGSNRLDEAMLGERIGEVVRMASADEVREKTGFAIGGVPPVGHLQVLRTFIDQDLMGYENIWAAAGTPRAVFQLVPEELVRITGGEIVSLA